MNPIKQNAEDFLSDVQVTDNPTTGPSAEEFLGSPEATSQPDNYWSDVRKNAATGFREIPGGALQLVDKANKLLKFSSPASIPKSIFQAYRGEPTDIGEGLRATKDLAVGAAAGAYDALKTAGKFAAAPFEYATGTPAKETMLGKQFRERPLSTIFNVATVAAPVAKKLFSPSVPKTPAGFSDAPVTAPAEAPNLLQMKGTQGLNRSVGIRGGTIERLTPSKENPAVVGTELMTRFKDEGAIGGSLPETLNNVIRLERDYGKRVGDVAARIRGADKKVRGGYTIDPYTGNPVESPLNVQSVPILKPILDEANTLLKGGYDDVAGNKMKRMYQNLQESANENNGLLTLDHIDNEMDNVGKMFEHAARDSDKFKMAATLYGRLARIRDSMVDEISKKIKDVNLKTEFIQANKGYSLYKRIKPDIRKAVSSEVTGQPTFGGIIDEIKNMIATNKGFSSGVLGAGNVLRGLSKEGAKEYLKRAGGNKTLARELAIRELQGLHQTTEQ